MAELEKNQLWDGECTGWSFDGAGVFRIEGRSVFVKNAIPGERCRVRILKAGSHAVYGRMEELLLPSPHRVSPACPQFGRCGGCDLMHVDYETELQMKRQRVADCLHRIGGVDLEPEEILAADRLEGWRNKVIYNLTEKDGTIRAGFFRQRSHDVVPADRCLLQPEAADRAAAAVCAWMTETGLRPYDYGGHAGDIRHVFCRSARDGALQVAVVSARDRLPKTERLTELVRRAAPETVGVLLNVNKTVGNTVTAGEFTPLWGEARLRDTLCGLEFSLSPRSFYQVNRDQAEKLYAAALDFAALTGTETAVDLYCGIGTITLCLAGRAGRVYGAEIVPEAVLDARENARRNGIENAEFLCGDAGKAARELSARGVRPDVVVVDPPRKGLAPETVDVISEMAPRRVVYVSCDPATLARDLGRFREKGFSAERVKCVDMFPRTQHCETVCLLTHK